MFPFIDKPIFRWMSKIFHKRSLKIVEASINKYIEKNHPDEETLAALRKLLTGEMIRVCDFSDNAITLARIKQARLTFWVTAILGTAITVAVAVYPPTTSLVVFFVPLMMAAVAWAVSIAAIPYYYNERIKGAMVSAIGLFEKGLQEGKELSPEATELLVLKSLVNEMQQHNDELTNRIQGLNDVQEKLIRRIDELTAVVEKTSAQNVVRNVSFWQPANEAENQAELESSAQQVISHIINI